MGWTASALFAALNTLGDRDTMLRTLIITIGIVALSGCASSGRVVQLSDVPIVGPKVIALDAPSAPWVIEIQNKLKQKGFKVLRWSSRTRVSEQATSNRIETFNEAEARYVLVIDGYAPYDWANRCFGGGYRFSHISTDLVDVATNQTILNVNGSGYSENCPPMSGTIFTDIANAVSEAWKE
jgi:hypothetical protein